MASARCESTGITAGPLSRHQLQPCALELATSQPEVHQRVLAVAAWRLLTERDGIRVRGYLRHSAATFDTTDGFFLFLWYRGLLSRYHTAGPAE